MAKKSIPLDRLDDNYRQALLDIRERFGGNARDAEAHFAKLYGEGFFKKTFFQGRFQSLEKETSAKDKLAIVAAHHDLQSASLGYLIRERMVGADDQTGFTPKYDGFYRYWRYYPTETQHSPVRWGVIEIRTDGEGTNFKHWSHDWVISHKLQENNQPVAWDRFAEPEDVGYAFQTPRQRMFMAAFRQNNIRLAISSLPESGLDKEALTGLMLSTRKGSGGVFSAAFVMVHQSNPASRESMKGADFRAISQISLNAEMLLLHD